MKNFARAALVLLLSAGCGGGETAPVTGIVTLDGQPVYPARVTFSPKADQGATEAGGRVATAMTEADGSYSIEAAAIGDNVVGVLILPADPDSEEEEDNERPAPPGKPEKDSYTVGAGSNEIDIRLASIEPARGRNARFDDDDD